jgi:5'-methylthioadenosine phosphorylase
MQYQNIKIGIIGGSGLYDIDGMQNIREIEIDTPFGKPSDKFVLGNLDGVEIAFLPRHGKGHFLTPTEVNYRANIYAMKSLGVETLISVSAVGSLKEELEPETLVIVDQFFDFTKHRKSTFFGEGIVAHVSMAEPICKKLTDILFETALDLGIKTQKGGSYFCMEGPQFSSKAESLVYRKLGFDVIGMTNATEAKLAKEAEMCYASLSFVTDYDCWHETEAPVTVEMVIEVLTKNVQNSKKILKKSILKIANRKDNCNCKTALNNSIITNQDKISNEIKNKMGIIISKYVV